MTTLAEFLEIARRDNVERAEQAHIEHERSRAAMAAAVRKWWPWVAAAVAALVLYLVVSGMIARQRAAAELAAQYAQAEREAGETREREARDAAAERERQAAAARSIREDETNPAHYNGAWRVSGSCAGESINLRVTLRHTFANNFDGSGGDNEIRGLFLFYIEPGQNRLTARNVARGHGITGPLRDGNPDAMGGTVFDNANDQRPCGSWSAERL